MIDSIDIEITPSALKHGVTEADIESAIQRFLYNEVMSDDESKHLLLGFDDSANLIEIIYNVADERTINVFHAMKCRKSYLSLLVR